MAPARATTEPGATELAGVSRETATNPGEMCRCPAPATFSRRIVMVCSCVMREAVIETSRMSLYFHPIENIIHHEMHAYPGVELLESVLTRGLELMKTHGAIKWLSDDRNGGAVPKSHHEWGERVWAPQAVKAGWRYWALLPPADVLGTANMKRLVKIYATKGVTVETFDDPEEAFNWLRHRGQIPTAQAT